MEAFFVEVNSSLTRKEQSVLFEDFQLGVFLPPEIQLTRITHSDYRSSIQPHFDVRL